MIRVLFFLLTLNTATFAAYVRQSLDLANKPLTEDLCTIILEGFVDDHPDAGAYLKKYRGFIDEAAKDNPQSIFTLLSHVAEVVGSAKLDFSPADVNPYLGELNFPWALYFKGIFTAQLYESDKEGEFESLVGAFSYFKKAYEAGKNFFALTELFKFYTLGWMSLDAFGDFKLLDHLEVFEVFAQNHYDAAHILALLYQSETHLNDAEKAAYWQKIASEMNIENLRYEESFLRARS